MSGRIRSSNGREKSRIQQLVELGRRIWAIGTIELICSAVGFYHLVIVNPRSFLSNTTNSLEAFHYAQHCWHFC